MAQEHALVPWPAPQAITLDYAPTLLNGEPVEIDATIDVIFQLRQ
jgi:hypothetical protein